MNKKTLAFVDHIFHIKSKSGDFLREIFKKEYTITNIWVDKSLSFSDKIETFENIFFFQIFPKVEILNRLKHKNIMWAPMYDSPHYPIGFSPIMWKMVKYYNVKILSFSKSITDFVQGKKINYLKLKYFKKPHRLKKNIKKKISIFFWNRGNIDLDDWINCVNLSNIDRIIYFDTEWKIKKPKILSNPKINYIKSNFTKKQLDFINLINKSDIFVCPRNKEGIGMAQIEALSMGKYLIGNNDFTMKDYIINPKIGMLFGNNLNKKIDIDNVINYRDYRLNHAKKGYIKFEKDKKKILKLFKKKIYFKNQPPRFFYFKLIIIFLTIKRKLFMLLK